MPEMNGDEMLKVARHPWGKTMKVVVLTNMGEQEIPEEVKQMGVVAVILKADMTPRQVAELVKQQLAASVRIAIVGFDVEGRSTLRFF